jgi:hypothetical protein
VKDGWDPKILALQIDLQAMRESKNFILFFPKKIPSSVLYEAGWALILGKPSIYITPNDNELPFLLNDASQAFPDQRVRIFKCPDTESMLKEVANYGDKLFHYREV